MGLFGYLRWILELPLSTLMGILILLAFFGLIKLAMATITAFCVSAATKAGERFAESFDRRDQCE